VGVEGLGCHQGLNGRQLGCGGIHLELDGSGNSGQPENRETADHVEGLILDDKVFTDDRSPQGGGVDRNRLRHGVDSGDDALADGRLERRASRQTASIDHAKLADAGWVAVRAVDSVDVDRSGAAEECASVAAAADVGLGGEIGASAELTIANRNSAATAAAAAIGVRGIAAARTDAPLAFKSVGDEFDGAACAATDRRSATIGSHIADESHGGLIGEDPDDAATVATGGRAPATAARTRQVRMTNAAEAARGLMPGRV